MKKQIITFIVGLLIGAIIATGSMVAYTKLTANNSQGNPPSMSQSSDGQSDSNQNGQPPEMPSGQNGGDNSNGTDQNQDNSNNQNSQGGTSSSGTSTTAA